VKLNGNIIIIAVVAIVMFMYLSDGTKKEISLCSSNEPMNASFKEGELLSVVKEGVNETGPFIEIDATYLNYTGVGFCKEINSTGECFNNKGIWAFNVDTMPSSLSFSSKSPNVRFYKGIPYFVLGKTITSEPNGIYYNDEKNIFIIYSAQQNDNIIKAYIDKFYNCTGWQNEE